VVNGGRPPGAPRSVRSRHCGAIAWNGLSNKADGPVKARIRDLVLPALMRQMTARGSLDWMFDYRIDWDASVSDAGSVTTVRAAGRP
jgi:hypothetical protein